MAGRDTIGALPKAGPPGLINPARPQQAGCCHGHDRRLTNSVDGAGADRSMDVIAVAA
jgi:hypothetical protein